MCEFPSWIRENNGTIVFLTDDDLATHFPRRDDPSMRQYDAVGHAAIRQVYPGIIGKDEEGFPPPPEISEAISRGKMRQMMRLAGYASLRQVGETGWEGIDSDGSWWVEHYENGKCIERSSSES